MEDEPSLFEESKVLESEYFGAKIFLLGDFDILAQAHGKEKGNNCELQDCTLELLQILFGNFGNDAGRDGFLLLSLILLFLKAWYQLYKTKLS